MKDGTEKPLGIWGWLALIAMLAFLVAAIAYAIHGWNALPGVGISTAGWLFLVLGIVFTLLVGGGLMALLFYSSRNDFDQ